MFDGEKIKKAVTMIIEAIGEDPEREGLKKTPDRVARMYQEIFSGLEQDAGQYLQVYFTEEQYDEMVLVKDIPIYSMCEHHFLPFYGKAHIAYIPKKGRITGLSKLARAVDTVAKRPQLQERLTNQVADLVMENLDAQGVVVVIEAEHMCMTMRGIKKPGSRTITSAIRGLYRRNMASRQEAFTLIKG
ncbi:MAG: GTP cyclohydrolase I FolE [Clostridia bacterium]|nr:GTP cyclohydrolase I FolE [Clostridia bacterium]